MIEEWKEIDFTNGQYIISNKGRIKRKKKFGGFKETLLNNHPKQPKIKRNKPYMMISINKKTYSVHRLVAIAFIPNPENKREVNHIDFDTLNNNASNLEWVTAKENKIHSREHMSLAKQGEKHPKSTMTDETALKIKIDRKVNKLKYKQLAKKYNLPEHTIANVATRYFRHLDSKVK